MKRTLLITAAVIAVFAAVGGVAFTFGTPQAPDVVATAAAPGAPAAEQVAVADAAVASGSELAVEQAAAEAEGAAEVAVAPAESQAVPEPDTNAPLAIQIPGCVCHSDDPKLVEEHSEYRMNQCAGCHAGGTPTGME